MASTCGLSVARAVLVVLWCCVAGAAVTSVAGEPVSLRGFGQFAVDRVTATGKAPGIRGSWSQKGIDYAREVAVAIIEKSVSSLHIPDISFDHDSISGTVSNFVCNDFKVLSSQSTLDAGKGVTLGTSISIACTADWKYRENIWPHIPHGSGTVDAATSDSSLSATIGITVVDQKPNVKALQCAANVNVNTLEFHGGLTGDLLNLLKGLIKSHIDSSMSGTLCTELSTVVGGAFNKVLDSFTYELQLDLPGALNISSAEFGLMGAPVITSSYVGVDLVGEVVNRDHPESPPFQPPALPAFQAADAGHMLQLYISRYVFNSGAWVFFQAGLEKFVVTPAMMPSGVPVSLNTSSPVFKSVAPGMAAKYPNVGIDLAMNVSATPMVSGNTSVANLTVPLHIAVMPTPSSGPVTAFELGCVVTGGLTAEISSQVLVGQVTEVNCPLTLLKSNVGAVDVSGLSAAVNAILQKVVVVAANKVLAKGFPIPTLDGVKFVNTTLSFGDGFVELATDLQFDADALLRRA